MQSICAIICIAAEQIQGVRSASFREVFPTNVKSGLHLDIDTGNLDDRQPNSLKRNVECIPADDMPPGVLVCASDRSISPHVKAIPGVPPNSEDALIPTCFQQKHWYQTRACKSYPKSPQLLNEQ